MDIETLTAFFMRCTVINGGIYLLWVVFCVGAPDVVYAMKSKLFPLPRETFNLVMYSFLGLFKILFIVFVLVPYIALEIVG